MKRDMKKWVIRIIAIILALLFIITLFVQPLMYS